MKRFAVWISIVATIALLFVNGLTVDAAPNGITTLSAGDKLTIVPGNCKLAVTKNTVTLVKVKCKSPAVAAPERVAGVPPIFLTAGQSQKILPNNCALQVLKAKASKVIIACNALENIVQVGNGGLNFGPSQITINAGETVKWTWSTGNHTVTSGTAPTPDNLFCSPSDTNCGTANASNSGATYEHTFNSAGTFNYFCAVHGASMSGSVVVNEN